MRIFIVFLGIATLLLAAAEATPSLSLASSISTPRSEISISPRAPFPGLLDWVKEKLGKGKKKIPAPFQSWPVGYNSFLLKVYNKNKRVVGRRCPIMTRGCETKDSAAILEKGKYV
jgi:hypothetical protein